MYSLIDVTIASYPTQTTCFVEKVTARNTALISSSIGTINIISTSGNFNNAEMVVVLTDNY